MSNPEGRLKTPIDEMFRKWDDARIPHYEILLAKARSDFERDILRKYINREKKSGKQNT